MSLDNLYRMKDAHKQMEKSDETVHPVTDEEMGLGEHDRTLADIMQDKKEQDRFLNRFCFEEDADMSREIADSLAGGIVLTQPQNVFLEKMRSEYNLRSAEVEKVQEMLTPEQIKRIGDTDPRIAQVIGQIGPEKTAELFSREFADLSLSNESAFKKVVKQMRLVRDIETNDLTAALDSRVREALFSYGINEEKYWEATRSGTTAETQENLAKAVSEQYGFFKKAVDFASSGKLSRSAGEKLYRNFEDQTALIKECDKHLKAIGKVLQGTLTADVNLAIQKAMLEGGDVKEKKVENNIRTIDEYKAIKAELETRQQRWEQYKQDETKRLGIKDLSKQQDALEGMKNKFSDQEYQKEKGYRAGAVFTALIALLFGNGTKDDIKNSLK